MNYFDCFQKATNQRPYPYQERVQAALESGSNLIITAPTGSGKTLAAVVPFLYALRKTPSLGDRMLYATPLRVLARTLHGETVKAATCLYEGKAQITTLASSGGCTREEVAISQQMGDCQEDPYFTANGTFTTIDQVLSAAIFHPVSLPRRLASIPAGSLVGAYLVFDEVHLLEPAKSLGTTLVLLDLLRGTGTRFVLMTATLSTSARARIAESWDAEIVELSEQERQALPAERARTRSWTWSDKPLDADAVRRYHKSLTLVVMNTVQRAQQLFAALRDSPPPETDVILLHSRFLPTDRRAVEDRVLDTFGKSKEPVAVLASRQQSGIARTRTILVATQVVEVGLDLSADCLLTEVAPINALVQRAGRCARWGGTGQVVVFSLPSDTSARPYEESLVSKTAALLEAIGHKSSVDFADEQEWIELVHGGPESGFLDSFSVPKRKSQVFLAIGSKTDTASVRELVRDISAVPVFVTTDPQRAWQSPGGRWPQLVSVDRSVIQGVLRRSSTSPQRTEPAKEAVTVNPRPLAWVPVLSEDDEEASWTWKPAALPEIAVAWLLALSPAIAHYDSETGLVLGQPGDPMPVHFMETSSPVSYAYRAEPWVEHARRTIEKARELMAHHHAGLTALAERYKLTPRSLEKCILLCAALHDTGKLTQKWQKWASSWQQVIASPTCMPTTALAHTDFDPASDYSLAAQVGRRPPHAMLGALATLQILSCELSDPLDIVSVNVIARHHGVDVEHAGELLPLVNEADQLVQEAASSIAALTHSTDPCAFEQWQLLQPCEHRDWADYVEHQLLFTWTYEEERRLWPLYVFVSRLLRIADQLATTDATTVANKQRS